MLPIIYVHIGDRDAPHLVESVEQTSRAAPSAPVHVILSRNTTMAKALRPLAVTIRYSDELTSTGHHRSYVGHIRRRLGKKRGFWRFATERFFLIEELMAALDIPRALHLESDNYIFFNPCEVEDTLEFLYPGLAAPFLNDEMCIPGVVYIGSCKALNTFNQYAAKRIVDEAERKRKWYVPRFMARVRMGVRLHDMNLLADFRSVFGPDLLNMLPVVPCDYVARDSILPRCRSIAPYCTGFDALQMVFDGSAIGHYLHGIDPAHHDATGTVGMVDPDSVVSAADFGFDLIDLKNRDLVPHLVYKQGQIRVASIHNHAKVRIL